MAEKMRRDKLNNYVNELAGIVPLGSGSTKRIDKTSVLRLAANYIRMHNILSEDEDGGGNSSNLGKVLNGNITSSLAEAVGGFLLVVTSTGKVVYITEAVDQFFGHSQVDLLGHSLYNVIHPDDHEIFQQQLIPRENTRRSFFCRMMEKTLSRNDPGRYEIIHIVGQLRPIPSTTTAVGGTTGPLQTIPSPVPSSDHDSDDCNSDEEENCWSLRSAAARQRVGTHMLVSFVRVVKDRPITELSLVESTQDEYITRHSMNGKILYTDHRISFVTGMMPTEVMGTSAFTYMHPDDMVWSVMAQRLMFSSTQGQGVISYRLRCRDGNHVNLRSRGYLEVNKQTGQVESFVCINTVLSIEEAKDEIKNQRRKLLPVVSSEECDDYLINISSSLPPELLTALKALMNPTAVKKLFGTLEDIDDGDKGKQTTLNSYSKSSVSSQDDCSSRVLQEVTLNHTEGHKDINPFQSKPKRLCNYEKPSSVTQKEEQYKVLEKDKWCGVPSKRISVDEFPSVLPKKLNYDQESSYQTCTNQHQQQYTSNTSTQMCPLITMPKNSDDSEFYPPPTSVGQKQQQQFNPVPYTTQIYTAENCGSESYPQNKHRLSSPSPSCDSGIASPMSHETIFSIERSPMPSSPYIQSKSPIPSSPYIQNTDKSPMPLSPYIQNTDKSPMPSSPYIQNTDKSPMPSSPYIQNTDKSPMPSSPYIQNTDKSPMPSSPYIQNTDKSPMPSSPYIQNTDKSPMPLSPYIQNTDKSPMPSSPYIQSVSSVDVLSPETHNHMKLSPNHHASQNHSNQTVKGRSNISNDEQSRNHNTRDNNFSMDIDFTNMVESNNGGRNSSNNNAVSSVSFSQMLPPNFIEGKMNVVNYPNACQWNENSKSSDTLNGYQISSNNAISNEQNYQSYNNSLGKMNHLGGNLLGNSVEYPVGQYAADPTKLENLQLQCQQNTQLQQKSDENDLQSRLEPDYIMNSIEGFDQNLLHPPPMRQMPHLGQPHPQAEPTSSYHSSTQVLPLEVTGNGSSCEGQGQASEQNLYIQLPHGFKRLVDKDVASRNGTTAVREMYNTPHHHQLNHPQDELL
ncbi:hypothetical protein Pmani_039286 [Petrolisthes manimaculis]|uniref:Methoprene-tolerant protein n=1 Tax=Petrolisthes manimaculis TaxID=1843537 RepID=A0AAE1TJF0_9EUCA|nr:hypothetical protein Pmani_039286 [Petrolisthes manimaculis]